MSDRVVTGPLGQTHSRLPSQNRELGHVPERALAVMHGVYNAVDRNTFGVDPMRDQRTSRLSRELADKS